MNQEHFAVAAIAAFAQRSLAARREWRLRGLLFEIFLERLHATQVAPAAMTVQPYWSDRIRRPSRKLREILPAPGARRVFRYARRLQGSAGTRDRCSRRQGIRGDKACRARVALNSECTRSWPASRRWRATRAVYPVRESLARARDGSARTARR